MPMKSGLYIALLLLSFALPVQADGKPVWVEAAGEARQGDLDTPREVMERAARDAQGRAIEQAVGVFLKSHTVVSNSAVAEDLIYAAVRGKIEKSETLAEGWDGGDRNLYRVRMRLLISPVYPEKGEGLSVRLNLSKADLAEGETVSIFYQAAQDCHVYLFSVAADGSVTLLFPNALQKENFTKAGRAYTFPEPGSPIRLQAAFLPGSREQTAEERIKLIATRKPEALLPLGFQEGLFRTYDARSTGMINDLVRRLSRMDPTEWTEATAVYTLRRQIR